MKFTSQEIRSFEDKYSYKIIIWNIDSSSFDIKRWNLIKVKIDGEDKLIRKKRVLMMTSSLMRLFFLS